MLAIEHDGARLRELAAARATAIVCARSCSTQLGWRLHRIWTLDWWLDPEREIQRAHGAIVAAIAASRQRAIGGITPPCARVARPRTGARRRLPPVVTAPVWSPPHREDRLRLDSAAHRARREAASPTRRQGRGGERPPQVRARLRQRPPRGGLGPDRRRRAAPPDSRRAGAHPARRDRIGPYAAAAIPAGRRAPDDMFAPRYLERARQVRRASARGRGADSHRAARPPLSPRTSASARSRRAWSSRSERRCSAAASSEPSRTSCGASIRTRRRSRRSASPVATHRRGATITEVPLVRSRRGGPDRRRARERRGRDRPRARLRAPARASRGSRVRSPNASHSDPARHGARADLDRRWQGAPRR